MLHFLVFSSRPCSHHPCSPWSDVFEEATCASGEHKLTGSNQAIWLHRAKYLLKIYTDDLMNFIWLVDKMDFTVATPISPHKWSFVRSDSRQAGRGWTPAALTNNTLSDFWRMQRRHSFYRICGQCTIQPRLQSERLQELRYHPTMCLPVVCSQRRRTEAASAGHCTELNIIDIKISMVARAF